MNPHILYWKWNDEVLCEDVMRKKALDIVNRSCFDYIYICFHSVSPENHILSSDRGVEMLRKCVELFGKYGRKVIIDTELAVEGEYIRQNFSNFLWNTKMFCKTLDKRGSLHADAENTSRILGCWVVDSVKDNTFENSVDITDLCSIENDEFIVSENICNSEKQIIYYLAKQLSREDFFSSEFSHTKRKIFERLDGIPFGGSATDEMGMGVSLGGEQKNKNEVLKPIDELDINKINFYSEWLPYSDNMSAQYEEKYGEPLSQAFLYFWHKEMGNEEKSIAVVNNFFELIRKRSAEIEAEHYNLTKEFFGEDAFVAAHPTWWGDELDNNFEQYYNGFDWWETKRDYAQTDELILIPIRLAMARKCSENIWYNMWYSMRTMDIKSYYKETYTNVIYSGRTHYLGYECYEPGVVLCLNAGDYLEKISETENKVAILDKLQKSSPDSRVLVIFGYEAATNHFISDPGLMRIERRGTVMHNVLKVTKELFEYPYLCELVPSTEIDNDFVKFVGNKVTYCGHEYDAVVLLYPDGITKDSFNKIRAFEADGGIFIVCGKLNVFHDGEKANNISFGNAEWFDEAQSRLIGDILEKKGVVKNKGKNYCVFEDGSITVANPMSQKSINNGVVCDELEISEDKYDIVFVNPEGKRYYI